MNPMQSYPSWYSQLVNPNGPLARLNFMDFRPQNVLPNSVIGGDHVPPSYPRYPAAHFPVGNPMFGYPQLMAQQYYSSRPTTVPNGFGSLTSGQTYAKKEPTFWQPASAQIVSQPNSDCSSAATVPVNPVSTPNTPANAPKVCPTCGHCNRPPKREKPELKDGDVICLDQPKSVKRRASASRSRVDTSAQATQALRVSATSAPTTQSVQASQTIYATPAPIAATRRSFVSESCCGILFTRFSKLKKHQRTVHQSASFRCSFENCSMQSDYYQNVLHHIRRIHLKVPITDKAQHEKNQVEAVSAYRYVRKNQ